MEPLDCACQALSCCILNQLQLWRGNSCHVLHNCDEDKKNPGVKRQWCLCSLCLPAARLISMMTATALPLLHSHETATAVIWDSSAMWVCYLWHQPTVMPVIKFIFSRVFFFVFLPEKAAWGSCWVCFRLSATVNGLWNQNNALEEAKRLSRAAELGNNSLHRRRDPCNIRESSSADVKMLFEAYYAGFVHFPPGSMVERVKVNGKGSINSANKAAK